MIVTPLAASLLYRSLSILSSLVLGSPETCEKELVSSFNKDNILDILTVAEQNDASKLKKHALENLNKCPPKSLNWQQLATEFPSILFDIMQMRFNQQLNSQKERRRGSDVSEQESFPPATPQLKRQRRH